MQYYLQQFTREDAVEWIRRNQARYHERGHGLLGVIRKDNHELIGDCGIVRQHVGGQDVLEVGYHFRRDQWGKGFATEAARACMRYAFEELGADKVISLIRPENTASRRVAERNGMVIESQVTYYGWPHYVYGMKREDYGKA